MLILLLLLAAEDGDGWPSNAEILDKYRRQLERARPAAIEAAESNVHGLTRAVRESRANGNSDVRALTIALGKEAKRLKGLRDKTVDPAPLTSRSRVGFGGVLVGEWESSSTDDVGLRIVEVIDEKSCVVSSATHRYQNVTLVHTKYARINTEGMKEGERFKQPHELWFVVGEDSWNGERIPVVVPIVK